MARIQNLVHFIPSKSFLNLSSLLLGPSMRNAANRFKGDGADIKERKIKTRVSGVEGEWEDGVEMARVEPALWC